MRNCRCVDLVPGACRVVGKLDPGGFAVPPMSDSRRGIGPRALRAYRTRGCREHIPGIACNVFSRFRRFSGKGRNVGISCSEEIFLDAVYSRSPGHNVRAGLSRRKKKTLDITLEIKYDINNKYFFGLRRGILVVYGCTESRGR